MIPLGGLVTLLVLLPNLLVVALPPRNIPPQIERPAVLFRMMETIERVGQAGAFIIPFFYPLPYAQSPGRALPALIVMVLALAFYYAGWARYALRGRGFALLFAPLLGVPLPMAISPILYFGAAAIFLGSWPLAAADLLLAAGHLFISQQESLRCRVATASWQPAAQ